MGDRDVQAKKSFMGMPVSCQHLLGFCLNQHHTYVPIAWISVKCRYLSQVMELVMEQMFSALLCWHDCNLLISGANFFLRFMNALANSLLRR